MAFVQDWKPISSEDEQMSGLIKSGIDLLDVASGGLKEGETYLINGTTGTGKTIMALQFLYEGIRRGESGLYLTDEKPRDLIFQGESLGMDLGPAIEEKKLCFLEIADDYANLVDRNTDVLALVEKLRGYLEGVNARRLVIDTIESLTRLNQSQQFVQGFTGSLLNFLSEFRITTFLIDSPQENDPDNWKRRLIERAAFGIYHLDWDDERSLKYMTIKKIRGTSFDPNPQYYIIENGNGIKLLTGNGEKVGSGARAKPDVSGNKRMLTIGLDDQTIAELARSFDKDWVLGTAVDGVRGIGEIEREKPSLLIMESDADFPQTIDTVKAIRGRGYNFPILIISCKPTRVNDRIKALKCGADELAEGPLRADELKARILSLLKKFGYDGFDDGRICDDEELRLKGVTGAERAGESFRDEPSIRYDKETRSYVIDPEQKNRILFNMDMVGELDVHFSLVFMKFNFGSNLSEFRNEGKDGFDRLVINTVISECREEDIIVRAMNDEIILILTGADSDGVQTYFGRINRKLNDVKDNHPEASVEYGFGRGSFPEDSMDYEEIIHQALISLTASMNREYA
jgi:KaiC/GvpD/RAD55 family RecA-like ATPase/DNA-binding response OmpR family regulator